jgi:hypothetical protein
MPRYVDADALIAWVNANAQTGTITTPPPDTGLPGGITPGKSLVFTAPFTDTSNWTAGRTSAYPGNPPQTNSGDNKLDRLDPTRKAPLAGQFAATKRTDGLWDCDLVTTEFSQNGFQLRAGDELSALCTVNQQQGAWPAVWTWKNGGNEVDCFEYHSDNPTMLEFTNHTNTNGNYFNYASGIVTPGKPFLLVTKFKTTGVEWWVDGTKIFTGTGVPSAWSAYIIVNMSVSAGKYHPAPTPTATQLYADVIALRVWR